MADLVVDVDALHSFSSGWRDGRKEIDGLLKTLPDMLTNSAQTFRQTDGA